MNTYIIDACNPTNIRIDSTCATTMHTLTWDWQHEYCSLLGKYGEMIEENKRLSAEIAQLKERLSTLKQ